MQEKHRLTDHLTSTESLEKGVAGREGEAGFVFTLTFARSTREFAWSFSFRCSILTLLNLSPIQASGQ